MFDEDLAILKIQTSLVFKTKLGLVDVVLVFVSQVGECRQLRLAIGLLLRRNRQPPLGSLSALYRHTFTRHN